MVQALQAEALSIADRCNLPNHLLSGYGVSAQASNLENLSNATLTEMFWSGDKFIANIPNGDGTYHDVTIKGIDAQGRYI